MGTGAVNTCQIAPPMTLTNCHAALTKCCTGGTSSVPSSVAAVVMMKTVRTVCFSAAGELVDTFLVPFERVGGQGTKGVSNLRTAPEPCQLFVVFAIELHCSAFLPGRCSPSEQARRSLGWQGGSGQAADGRGPNHDLD